MGKNPRGMQRCRDHAKKKPPSQNCVAIHSMVNDVALTEKWPPDTQLYEGSVSPVINHPFHLVACLEFKKKPPKKYLNLPRE